MKAAILSSVAFVLTATMTTAGHAEATNFYAGKTITIICPYSPGGTYDRMARLAARYLPMHIPGHPSAVVENRPGGGGVIGLGYVYRANPDGLTIAHFTSPIVVRQLSGAIKNIDFRKMEWLGSVGGAHYLFFMRSDRKEHTIEALRKAATPIRVGVMGPGSLITQAGKFLKRAGKFNMRLVHGYKGYSPITLAIKQNEVDGVATAASAVLVNTLSHQMYKDKTIRLTLSMGGAPAPAPLKKAVASLPSFVDAIPNKMDRKAYVAFSGLLSASRPFATTPGVPAARLAVLRKAMSDMMADPAFVQAATKQGFVLNPLNGEQARKAILSVFNLPSDIQNRLNVLLQ